jgi:hypothetical protein
MFCDLMLRLEMRRAKLFLHLQSLYPIRVPQQMEASWYSIRDIQIPAANYHSIMDDDSMSSALGYICHLVIMVAKYLSVIFFLDFYF